jgi:hypothetical protein
VKQYYTLVQPFQSEANRDLGHYLKSQDIDYTVGADTVEELRKYGCRASWDIYMMYKYVVLIEEHELSAISLCISDVDVIRNRSEIDLKNKIRSYFKWFLN